MSAPDRRQALIEAALDLFARQGYNGTTTRQIAERAGVNEAIIYRHFPRKEDLYWAVLEAQCRPGRSAEIAELFASSDDDLYVFSKLAEDMLLRREKDSRLSRLLLFAGLENHELSHRFFRTYISIYHQQLAARIRQRVEQGRFRNIDPLLAARGFLGMVVHHFHVQELFGGKHENRFPAGEVAQELAQIWLFGMLKQSESPIRIEKNGHAWRGGANGNGGPKSQETEKNKKAERIKK
jgi:AcrR family transcriptional regulator